MEFCSLVFPFILPHCRRTALQWPCLRTKKQQQTNLSVALNEKAVGESWAHAPFPCNELHFLHKCGLAHSGASWEPGRVEMGRAEALQRNSNCSLGTQGRVAKCSDFSLLPSAEEKPDWRGFEFFFKYIDNS